MATWNRNKVPPANLNAGQQYNSDYRTQLGGTKWQGH